MATKSLTYRQVLELINDTGESPSCGLDETFPLEAYKETTRKRIVLGASDTDVSIGITDEVAAFFILSHDYPFKVRLKTAEKQLLNCMSFSGIAADLTTALYDGTADNILLDGNGSNDADIEIFLIHKP